MKTLTTRIATTALVGTLALAGAACGGDDDATSPGQEDTVVTDTGTTDDAGMSDDAGEVEDTDEAGDVDAGGDTADTDADTEVEPTPAG